MKIRRQNNSGAAHFLLLGALLIVAVAGFAAYRVSQNQKDDVASQSTTATRATVPETIQNNDDLTQAEAAAKAASVDSDLDPAQLDNDIDSLL